MEPSARAGTPCSGEVRVVSRLGGVLVGGAPAGARKISGLSGVVPALSARVAPYRRPDGGAPGRRYVATDAAGDAKGQGGVGAPSGTRTAAPPPGWPSRRRSRPGGARRGQLSKRFWRGCFGRISRKSRSGSFTSMRPGCGARAPVAHWRRAGIRSSASGPGCRKLCWSSAPRCRLPDTGCLSTGIGAHPIAGAGRVSNRAWHCCPNRSGTGISTG